MNKRNSPPNSNFSGRQNQGYSGFENCTNSNNYYQNPQRPVRYPDKRKKRDLPGLKLLITLVCALVILVIVYIILYINIFSFKSELNDVLISSGNTNAEIIEDLKVDDYHSVYIVNDNGELSASYIQIKGTGEEKSYKCLKTSNSLNLETYKNDMQGEDIDFSSKGDFNFALDFSGSEQYDKFIEYFDENNIKDYKACPVNIDGINQIFIVWMWNK